MEWLVIYIALVGYCGNEFHYLLIRALFPPHLCGWRKGGFAKDIEFAGCDSLLWFPISLECVSLFVELVSFSKTTLRLKKGWCTEIKILQKALHWEGRDNMGYNWIHLVTTHWAGCKVWLLGGNCDTLEQNGFKRKHLVTTSLQLCNKNVNKEQFQLVIQLQCSAVQCSVLKLSVTCSAILWVALHTVCIAQLGVLVMQEWQHDMQETPHPPPSSPHPP